MVKTVLLPLVLGFGTGILSAWGVGGGTLLLLIMTLFLGVEQSAAQGINLLYFLPTAAAGLWYHRKSGLLDKSVLRRAIPAGLAMAIPAAWLATRIDLTVLRRPFGVFLLLCGALMLKKEKK